MVQRGSDSEREGVCGTTLGTVYGYYKAALYRFSRPIRNGQDYHHLTVRCSHALTRNPIHHNGTSTHHAMPATHHDSGH